MISTLWDVEMVSSPLCSFMATDVSVINLNDSCTCSMGLGTLPFMPITLGPWLLVLNLDLTVIALYNLQSIQSCHGYWHYPPLPATFTPWGIEMGSPIFHSFGTAAASASSPSVTHTPPTGPGQSALCMLYPRVVAGTILTPVSTCI